jgi:hypothetical protein
MLNPYKSFPDQQPQERLINVARFSKEDIQRALARYAKQCTATRLRRLDQNYRYAVLACFPWQNHLDTIDYLVEMFEKLINRVYKHA